MYKKIYKFIYVFYIYVYMYIYIYIYDKPSLHGNACPAHT